MTRRSTQANGEPISASKKRRIPGACDNCKKKKIRCDSAAMPGNRCSSCAHFQLECTHKEVSKTLGPAKGYVESLENRLEKMESLLRKLSPKIDLNQELGSPDPDESISTESSAFPKNDEEEPLMGTLESLEQLHLSSPSARFFGKSSGYQLVQTALDFRSQYTGEERVYQSNIIKPQSRREEFWHAPEWRRPAPPPDLIFPDPDLTWSLVDNYFTQINSFLPLLHRPSFDRSIADGQHVRDRSFGCTLLLVCAIGAQYSEDPRVFTKGSNSLHSAGWKWFKQVSLSEAAEEPTLSDLQNHALSVVYGRGAEAPRGHWVQLGTALRLAQEFGAHRSRPPKASGLKAEDEQWKRAFWVLLVLDRQMSSFSGRQCVLQDEDYDVELPIDHDDEYHPDPTVNFQLPLGKPSSMAFFHCYLRLHDILATAMRALYSLKKPDSSGSRGADPQIIISLDSAMNSWIDSVPSHLRWNSKCENWLFFNQSATLYVTYYYVQIFIHRPFIPSFRNPSPSKFPSLAICTNAARSSCHIFEVQSRINLPLPVTHPIIFTSAVVLLLHIWSSKRSECAPYPRREIEDVKKCLDILEVCERRWCPAGRYRDVLSELVTVGNVSFASPRTETVPSDVGQNGNITDIQSVQSTLPNHPRTTADPRGVSTASQDTSAPPLQSPNYALPMYSTELGRLPIYEQFNFRDSRANSASVGANVDYPGFVPSRPTGDVQDVSNPGISSSLSGSVQGFHTLAEPLEWDTLRHSSSENGDMTREPPAQSDHDTMSILDDDTITMWSTAPAGFELSEWGTYVTSVNQMAYAQDSDKYFAVQ